jgi:hypothetical protein
MPRSNPPAPQDYGREPQDSFRVAGLRCWPADPQPQRRLGCAAWVMRTGSILEGITLPPYT